MTDLILTGFMGTGKTTVGRILSRRFGRPFVDLDEEIVRSAGQSIPEIFAASGESSFRALERETLERVLQGEDQIIATGGGTLLSPENRDLLREDHAVICLTCCPEELERRLQGSAGRPLLPDSGDELRSLLDRRGDTYALFSQIDTSHLAPEAVADLVSARVPLAPAAHLHMNGQRDSTVAVEIGILRRLGDVLREHGLDGHVLIVTDDHVAELGFADVASSALNSAGFDVDITGLPAGEAHKSLASLQQLYATCMDLGLDRASVIVGLGGGVIGDLAGMAAATYLRGLPLVLVPTTLLAQVDASVGGKVGVDFLGAKNLIGAFHPATLVAIDPETLETLPSPALSAGMAEVVKLGLVRSVELLELVESVLAVESIPTRADVIRRAVQEKVAVVEADPFERGERMLLNFGHTVGHALEASSGYRLAHGYAVGIGMNAETWLAESRGWCRPGVLDRLQDLLSRFVIPQTVAGLDPEAALGLVRHDKKRANGALRMAAPTSEGEGAVFPVSEDDIRAAISRVTGEHS